VQVMKIVIFQIDSKKKKLRKVCYMQRVSASTLSTNALDRKNENNHRVLFPPIVGTNPTSWQRQNA